MTVPSLLILGTDAVLAASPATPVQLAHGCLAAGYAAVIPATWGDELIAARALDRLREADGPLVMCSCPFVADRLAANAADIAPMVLALVSPPVAAARYLRAAYAPSRLHITFAGACPGANNEAIDLRLSVDDLLRSLAERGIAIVTQPKEFDAVLPPDRRRFYSDPGGLPAVPASHGVGTSPQVLELGPEDLLITLAQHLLQPPPILLDFSPTVGCRCSGAGEGVYDASARERVRALEPPRAFSPVVDHGLSPSLDAEIRSSQERRKAPISSDGTFEPVGPTAPLPLAVPAARTSIPASAAADDTRGSSSPIALAMEANPRRLSSALSRPMLAAMPHARTESGRHLPRAFVARRRSTPSGLRAARPSHSASPKGQRHVAWYVAATTLAGGGLILAWLFRWIP